MGTDWQTHKQAEARRGRQRILDISQDMVITREKRILLSDDILRLIWMIRKKSKRAVSDRQVIRKALVCYSKTLPG